MRTLAAAVLVLWAGAAVALQSGSVEAPYRPPPSPGADGATDPGLAEAPTPTPSEPPSQSEGPEKPHPEGWDPGISLRDGGARFVRPPARETEAVERGMTPIDSIDTAEMPGATLRGLDKMTGLITTFDLTTGERRGVERLIVQLVTCRTPETSDVSGTMAFLHIWDTKGEQDREVFSGWMFAASPALSAMDHPRYDLWLIDCTAR